MAKMNFIGTYVSMRKRMFISQNTIKDCILPIVYIENSLKHENYKQRPWKGFYLGVKTIRSSLSMSIKCSISIYQ